MRLINRRPSRGFSVFLALLPFLVGLVAYAIASDLRLAANPGDKLLPAFSTLADGIRRMAFVPDPRTGDYLMLADTLASLERLAAALAIAALIGLVLGLVIGLVPLARALLGPLVAVISMVPPLALLPILFIVLGLGEAAKITLIAIGVTPFLVRDLAARVEELPVEQLIKAQTLGGSTAQIALRIVLPQLLPRLLDALRLSLGPAFLFLIAAEAIASESGLGYRIFLVRRYLSMDVILPYVAWITLLAFLIDLALKRLQRRFFPWFAARAGQ
ncbi:ABC transporter permease [Prosthecomicrobium pneumaticum]|uniref:NitT/TauT family transport system permease protein n=1 Tax=Prosthecomicrobium pneumaticum TaxID=81895 RepID=A0A7W9FQ71_9HYPH|nr:ABC transporter permease subunit [Prosthecomicrobium pneumaticum]MBB5754858.1 NitT/TauT family transport system permease protein [Prosthecomicrobium pneumaticum]